VGSFSIAPIGTYAASTNFHQPRDTTLVSPDAVNGGEKMHRRGGTRMHQVA
jgi:hypothetical protein